MNNGALWIAAIMLILAVGISAYMLFDDHEQAQHFRRTPVRRRWHRRARDRGAAQGDFAVMADNDEPVDQHERKLLQTPIFFDDRTH